MPQRDHPAGPPAGRDRKAKSQTVRLIIGYALAAICMVWVFHDLDWKKFVQNIASMNWLWIPAAVILDVVGYFFQGIRWHLLLRPQGGLSVWRTTEAIFSGLFLNEILPLRVGEVARGYLVARWMSKPFAAIIPSMALERLMEGIWVAIAIAVVAFFVPLPKDLLKAGNILGFTVLLATGLFLFFVLRKGRSDKDIVRARAGQGRVGAALNSFFRRLGNELRAIGLSRYLSGAFLATLLMYVLQILAFWLVMESYGIRLSILSGAAIFLIVHLGTALPNAPGNVGTYQFFCVVGLAFFGVDKTTATGFSVVFFILLSIPLWVLGAVAFGRSGMTLAAFRQKVPQLQAEEER